MYQGKTEFSPDVYAKRNLNVVIIIVKVDNEILPTTFISFLILMPLATQALTTVFSDNPAQDNAIPVQNQ